MKPAELFIYTDRRRAVNISNCIITYISRICCSTFIMNLISIC